MDCQTASQGDFLPVFLTGSQKKTAFALRHNVESMVESAGVQCCGFLTLTVGDSDRWRRFSQVRDASEASRRFNNLNRRVLRNLFERAVVVTERHRSGAIHFHVVGVLRGRPDIRTGFDFEAVKRRDYRSASPALRAIWKFNRETLPNYGFGRAELLPIRETGAAVGSYVAKYVEKNVCNRLPEDKGKKLVRYLGWEKGQLKPADFSWFTPRAHAWRWKARGLCRLVGFDDREKAAEFFGPRWAWLLTRTWRSMVGDDLFPGFLWETWGQREAVRMELVRVAGRARCVAADEPTPTLLAVLRDWGSPVGLGGGSHVPPSVNDGGLDDNFRCANARGFSAETGYQPLKRNHARRRHSADEFRFIARRWGDNYKLWVCGLRDGRGPDSTSGDASGQWSCQDKGENRHGDKVFAHAGINDGSGVEIQAKITYG